MMLFTSLLVTAAVRAGSDVYNQRGPHVANRGRGEEDAVRGSDVYNQRGPFVANKGRGEEDAAREGGKGGVSCWPVGSPYCGRQETEAAREGPSFNGWNGRGRGVEEADPAREGGKGGVSCWPVGSPYS